MIELLKYQLINGKQVYLFILEITNIKATMQKINNKFKMPRTN